MATLGDCFAHGDIVASSRENHVPGVRARVTSRWVAHHSRRARPLHGTRCNFSGCPRSSRPTVLIARCSFPVRAGGVIPIRDFWCGARVKSEVAPASWVMQGPCHGGISRYFVVLVLDSARPSTTSYSMPCAASARSVGLSHVHGLDTMSITSSRSVWGWVAVNGAASEARPRCCSQAARRSSSTSSHSSSRLRGTDESR